MKRETILQKIRNRLIRNPRSPSPQQQRNGPQFSRNPPPPVATRRRNYLSPYTSTIHYTSSGVQGPPRFHRHAQPGPVDPTVHTTTTTTSAATSSQSLPPPQTTKSLPPPVYYDFEPAANPLLLVASSTESFVSSASVEDSSEIDNVADETASNSVFTYRKPGVLTPIPPSNSNQGFSVQNVYIKSPSSTAFANAALPTGNGGSSSSGGYSSPLAPVLQQQSNRLTSGSSSSSSGSSRGGSSGSSPIWRSPSSSSSTNNRDSSGFRRGNVLQVGLAAITASNHDLNLKDDPETTALLSQRSGLQQKS